MVSSATQAQAPQGATVAAGSVAVTQQGATTVVSQTSARGIIDWRSFSIGPNNVVRFDQPGASSVTLNRVTGAEISRLDGSLTSNGQVWLSNPNGLIIGPGGQVNVGGLLATTGRIDPQSFLASGRAVIDGMARDAAIVNRGVITVGQGAITVGQGGYAALAAASIRNEGVIAARAGSVALGAGRAATIDFAGDRLIQFQVTEALDRAPAGGDAAIVNSGTLAAEGGTVLLSARAAKGVMDNVINLRGLTISNRVKVDGGTVSFGDGGAVQVSGAIDASSATERGGTVAVLGESVALKSGALINASGATGGGAVSIGGDWQGAGPNHNAQTATVASGAVVTADAIQGGQGGRVVVWADGVTRVDGTLTAQGGQAFGDGGAIETSGKRLLSVGRDAKVSAQALRGKVGDWLLDPLNITVATGGSATLAAIADASDTTSSLTVDPNTLNSAAANVTLAAAGSVTFTDPVSMTNAFVSLSVNADKTFINNTIATNSGAVTIRNFAGTGQSSQVTFGAAGAIGAGTGAVDISAASIGLRGIQSANSFDFGAGAVTLTGAATLSIGVGDVVIGGSLNGASSFTVSGAGTTSLTGGVGGLTPLSNLTLGQAYLGGIIATTGTQSYAAVVKLASNATLSTANAGLIFSGPVNATASGAQALTLSTGSGVVTFGNGFGGLTPLASLTAGAAAIAGASETIGTQSFGGPVRLVSGASLSTSNANITFASTVNAATGAEGLTLKVGAGVASLTSGVGGVTALSSLAIDNAVLGGSIITSGLQSYGAVTLLSNTTMTTSGGGIAFGTVLNGPGAITLSSGGTPIKLAATVGATTALASVTQVGSGIITAFDSVRSLGTQSYASAVVIAGNGVFSTSNAALTFSGPIDANSNGGNPLVVSTGTGAISFGNHFGVGAALASFTQLGTGAVSLGGDYKTTGSQVFTGNILLAPAVTTTIASTNGPLTIGTAGGTISSSGGTGSLTLSSGLGDMDVNSTITNLTNLTLTGTNAMATVGSVSVLGAVNVAGMTGSNPGAATATFTGAVNAGNFITSATQLIIGFQQNAAFTSAGNVTLANIGGIITGVVGGPAITVSNTGGLTINGPVVNDSVGSLYQTNGTPITFGSPLVLSGSTVFDTTNGGLNVSGASISLAGLNSDALATPRSVAFKAGTAGTISVSGAIGAVTPLSSLRVFSAALTKLDGSVVTIGAQRYAGPVVIGGNAVFSTTNANVIFSGPLDGDAVGGQALSFNLGVGTVSLVGGVGATKPLGTLTVGNAALGGSVTTIDAQSYGGQVTVMAGSITLSTSSTSTGDIILGAGGGLSYAQGGAGALALLAGRDILMLAGSRIISTGASLDVTLNAGATATTQSTVSGGISITGGTIATMGGRLAMVGGASGALAASGGATLGGRGVYVRSGSVINLAGGTLTVAGAGASPLALANMAGVEFNGSTVTASGGVVITGVGGANAASFGHGVVLQGSTFSITGGTTSITGAGGVGTAAATGVLIGGASVISGGDVVISGTGGGGSGDGIGVANASIATTANNDLQLTGASGAGGAGVSLNGATLSTANGDVVFQANSLLKTGGAVATSTGTIKLQSLAANAAISVGVGGGALAISSGFLSGLTGPVEIGRSDLIAGVTVAPGLVLNRSTTIRTGGGSVAFQGAVDSANGAQSLTLATAGGAVSFGGAVGGTTALSTMTVTNAGPSFLGFGVTTNGAQSFGGAIVLNNSVMFSAGNANLKITGSVNGSTVGGQTLNVSVGTGTVLLIGSVGSVTPLASLTLPTARLSGVIRTVGAQSYGAVTLQNNATLSTVSGGVAFGASLDGPGGLTLATGANAVQMAANVGASTPLAFLTQSGTGALTVRNGVFTTGTQSYGGVVVIAGAGVFSTSNKAITFTNELNAKTAGGFGPTFAAGSGAVALNGGAGGSTALANLTTTGSGAVSLGGNVTTAGAQDFAGPVALTNDVALNAGGSIGFGGAVDSATGPARSLSMTAGAGSVTLVNSGAALNQITVSAPANASIASASGFTLAGATVAGTLSLTSGGVVIQTGALSAPNLAITGSGGDFQLTNASNMIGVVAVNTGALTLVNGGGSALAIDAVGGLTGVTLSAGGSIQQTGSQSLTLSAPVSASGNALSLSSAVSILGGGLVTAANLTLSAGGNASTVAASYGAITIAAGTITVNGAVMMPTTPTVPTTPSVPSVSSGPTSATGASVPTVTTVASVPTIATIATQASVASVPSTPSPPSSPSPPPTGGPAIIFTQNSGDVLVQILNPPVNFNLGFAGAGTQATLNNTASSGVLSPNAAAASAAVTSTLSGAWVPLQPASVGPTGAPLAAARTIKVDAADTGGANGQVIAFGGVGGTQVLLPGLLSLSMLRPPKYILDDEVPPDQLPPQMNEEPLLD